MRNYPNTLLDPTQSVVMIIDHQPQMYFGVESVSRSTIQNNVLGLAKAAKLFNVPCILTTVEANSFSGPMIQKLQDVYPKVAPIDRTTINAWEDEQIKTAMAATGRKKVILAGLWTEACVLFPALCMVADGYDVYVATDACGGATKEAHDMAVQRMIQGQAHPITSMQAMLEWQRDWANKDTYQGIMAIVKEHGGAYGIGVEYAEKMLKK